MELLEKIRKPLIVVAAVPAVIALIAAPVAMNRSAIFIFLSLFILLGAVIVAFYHRGEAKRTVFTFLLVAFLGWFVEMLGVKTGAIFGVYTYGETLGIKALGVPFVVGIHWAVLIYLAYAATSMLPANNRRMAAAAGLIVIYDIFLEPAASRLGMWHFERNDVPFQNYVSWFLLSYLLLNLVRRSKLEYTNSMATPIFAMQLIFLLLLDIILLTFKI